MQRSSKSAGFTLVELLVAVVALSVIIWGLAAFVPSLQRDIELRTNRERMAQYAAEFERMWLYRITSVTYWTLYGYWPSGGFSWGNAEQVWLLGSSFGAASPLSDSRAQELSRDAWDNSYTVFVSASRMTSGPEGTTLFYRDLWIVSSGVDRTLNSVIGSDGNLSLGGDDFAVHVDGRALAERAVRETFGRLDEIAVLLQLHAQRRMLADTVRDPLRFYFASCSDSTMCDPNNAGTLSRPTGWLVLSLSDSSRAHATLGIPDQLLLNRDSNGVWLGMGTGGAIGNSPPSTAAFAVGIGALAPAYMDGCLGYGGVCRTVMQVN